MNMITLLESGDNIEQLVRDLESEVASSLGKIKKGLDAIPNEANLFLHGKSFGVEWVVFQVISSKLIRYEDLMTRYELISAQISAIVREKGFRYNILTYNEHRRIGSTVWMGFADEPDVPLGVLVLRRGLGYGQEQLTVEEAGIARELEGKTTLDEEGRVTETVNPDVKDSYHFLTAQRKSEIIKLEQTAIRDLTEIAQEAYERHQQTHEEFLLKAREYMVGRLSTPEMKEVHGKAGFEDSLVERAWLMSFHYGFRDYMLTPQEIRMSGRKVERKHRAQPYVPIGIQSRSFSIEKIRLLREQERYFPAYTRAFSEFRMPFRLSLEPLTDNAETIRGPTICDDQTGEPQERGSEIVEYFSKQKVRVPYARPQDWYFKEST